MTEFFEADDVYTGPPLDAELLHRAQQALHVQLPRAYIELLTRRNGGVPRRRCFPTDFSTSWASDHFEIRALLGVGGDWGIDSESGQGSKVMIAEWGYPGVGLVVCDMPSGGTMQ